MRYYQFPINSSIFQKYKEFANKATNETESIYTIIRPLGATGLYRNDSEVLGVVFPKDVAVDESKWDLIREDDTKKIYIPNKNFVDWKYILVELEYTDSKLKKELFNLESFEYFAYVLTDKWLRVETTADMKELKQYKTRKESFRRACDKYKKMTKR